VAPGRPFQTASNCTRKPNDPESGSLVGGSSPEPGPPGASLSQTAQNWDTAKVLSQLNARAHVPQGTLFPWGISVPQGRRALGAPFALRQYLPLGECCPPEAIFPQGELKSIASPSEMGSPQKWAPLRNMPPPE
jgi:hypothetical protein